MHGIRRHIVRSLKMCLRMLFYRYMKKIIDYFTKAEIALWVCSVLITVLSFIIFDTRDYLILSASLVGVTSLIFNAKGNPAGQVLMIIFSILYGIISYTFGYYGEMVTYLAMTMPMAFFALISWLKNPYKGKRSQVTVGEVSRFAFISMCISCAVITVVFYFILKYFNTANLFFSTVSVTTSYIAAYFTFLRSPYFAVAYAANDVVLIVLWTLASFSQTQYVSVIICFIAFLFNDVYGYINWRRMQKTQSYN